MNGNRNLYCNNCNKRGHVLVQCLVPITSYGIIAFRKKNDIYEYLMIERKNSFGYIDFIRGTYSLNNLLRLQALFDEMTINEKNLLMTNSFGDMWNEMWGYASDDDQPQHFNSERLNSEKRFTTLKNGTTINDETELNIPISINILIENSCTNWECAEWEFPKGRRSAGEKDIICALREFTEETGYQKEFISLVENVVPYEERFVGTNYKPYIHKYFLAREIACKDILDQYQPSEVRQLRWMTYEQCMDNIRIYNTEKKAVLTKVNTLINTYLIL